MLNTKKVKRIFALLFAVCMSANIFCISAFASDEQITTQSVVYHTDGSYTVTTITSNQFSVSAKASVQKKSGEKEVQHYDRSNQLLWTFKVIGSFSYDGYSAEATFADYSYDIYDSTWSLDQASASYSGATATAQGRFLHYIAPHSVSLSLTCSPKGVLS